MKLNEEAQGIVRARAQWNQTGVALVAGETYDFVAAGCWTDLVIPHGPGGDPSDSAYMRLFERWRRVPSANWFTLIGIIDAQMQSAFVIGSRCRHTPQVTGQLTCFANDVSGFYWNNFGAVRLTVTRVA
jgi:hypothetical protein